MTKYCIYAIIITINNFHSDTFLYCLSVVNLYADDTDLYVHKQKTRPEKEGSPQDKVRERQVCTAADMILFLFVIRTCKKLLTESRYSLLQQMGCVGFCLAVFLQLQQYLWFVSLSQIHSG